MSRWMVLLVSLPLSLLVTNGVRASAPSKADVTNSPVIKISESGFAVRNVHLKREDGFVFFYNDSRDVPVKVDILFGDHHMHCATPNMQLESKAVAQAGNYIQPGSFSAVCFPERGEYRFQVIFDKPAERPKEGTIIVE